MKLEFSVPYSGINYRGEPYSGKRASDWQHAFDVAGLDPEEVVDVINADEGENDGESWICYGQLANNSFFFLTAWCDYTGWDCQAGGEFFTHYDLEQLKRFNMSDRDRERLGIVLEDVEGVSPIPDMED